MSNATQIKQQFKSAIRRGTGEAYLLMQRHPGVDFSNEIIKASVKNFAYDGQCESSRAPYLFELITLSGQREKIRNAILAGLATEKKDTWSLTQLFDLAKLFAQQNDEEARQAIYDRFLNNPIDYADWAGYSAIIELDGIEGLKYIAEKMGRALKENPDDWQDGGIINHFQENNPDIKVLEALEAAGESNPFIAIYLENVKRTDANAKNYKEEQPIATDIIEKVLMKSMSFNRRRKDLDDADVHLIAQRLLREKNIRTQEKLLAVFAKYRRFPLDHHFLLKLADENKRSKSRLVYLAVDALSLINDEEIRQFALARINAGKNSEMMVQILKSNYHEGDDQLLTELVGKFNNEDAIESLTMSYIDIYNTHKTKACKKPLESIYDKSNCAIHRESVVRILMENNALSEKIKEELKFDCNEDIRKMVN